MFEDYMDGCKRVLVQRLSRPDGGSYPAPEIMLKSAFYAGACAALGELEVDSSKRRQLLDEIEMMYSQVKAKAR